MNRSVAGLLRWTIALAMPIFLLLTISRLMIADWFPRYEYSKPDFPRERYGWTQQERLDLALPSIHFLNSPLPAEQAVAILAAQRHPASDRSLFSSSELSHMVDVKRVVDRLWRIQVIAAFAVVLSLAVLLARRATRRDAYLALQVGGILTAGLLLVLALFVLVGFDTFFVQFHEIFFPRGNWTFDYRDSLIRLFPEKLWFDAGFMITGGTFLAGIVVTLVGYLLGRRSARRLPATDAAARAPTEA